MKLPSADVQLVRTISSPFKNILSLHGLLAVSGQHLAIVASFAGSPRLVCDMSGDLKANTQDFSARYWLGIVSSHETKSGVSGEDWDTLVARYEH